MKLPLPPRVTRAQIVGLSGSLQRTSLIYHRTDFRSSTLESTKKMLRGLPLLLVTLLALLLVLLAHSKPPLLQKVIMAKSQQMPTHLKLKNRKLATKTEFLAKFALPTLHQRNSFIST